MRSVSRLRLASLALTAGLAFAPTLVSAPPHLAVRLTGTLGYDDNVYAIDTGPLARLASPFSTLAASLALTPSPGLSLAYSPSATRYFEANRENHVKHVLATSWKQEAGRFSWRAATDLIYLSGDHRGTDYGPGHGSAFSTILPRERRAQFQNKTDLLLRYDAPAGFVRTFGRLASWDMRTTPVAGANYVDRFDLQSGLDLGRTLRHGQGPEIHLGYRHGYQYQDRDAYPASPRHASNHYDRFVLGYEGRLASSLTLSGEVGWSRHSYSTNPAFYAGPPREDGRFTDLTLTWTATPKDELQLKTSQGRTMSTTGVNAFLYTLHQLHWKHTFDPRWSATVTIRLAQAEYSPAARHDALYGLAASLTHVFHPHLSATLAATADRGRELHPTVVGTAAAQREFNRHLLSLTVTWKR